MDASELPPPPLVLRLERALRGRRFLLLVLVLGTLLFSPALRSGLLLDDYLHATMVEGHFPSRRGPTELYDFVSDRDREALLSRDLFPWWTDAHLTVRFFRPLSSAALSGVHRVFGRRALPLHLYSYACWLFAILASHALLRALLPRRAASLATLVLALAPCHAVPLAWVANSEALLSLAFGALALRSYSAWREARAPLDALLSAALFTLCFATGEYSLCFGGYVLALELTRREGLLARFTGMLSFALPAAAYLGLRAALGYGTRASGFYLDPLREPATFLAALPWRVLCLLSNLLLTTDLDGLAGAWARGWYLLLVTGAFAGGLFVARWALSSLEAPVRARAQWLSLGSLLALLPVLAVVPNPRTLGASMLGFSALLGLCFEHAWAGPARLRTGRSAELLRGLVSLAAFAHLFHGPFTAAQSGAHERRQTADFARHLAALRARVPDFAHRQVTVLRGSGVSFFAPFGLSNGGPLPDRWRVLALTGHVLVMRPDERTLLLVAPREHGVFLADRNNLFRSPGSPLVDGAVLERPGVRVTVLQGGEHGPRRVRFEFEHDLDSPEYLWLNEDSTGFRVLELPAPGFGMPLDP